MAPIGRASFEDVLSLHAYQTLFESTFNTAQAGTKVKLAQEVLTVLSGILFARFSPVDCILTI